MIAIVLGTRPEIIKLAPLIRELRSRSVDYLLVHSNQHYDQQMDQIFFKQMLLPSPDYNLKIGSGSHGQQTAKVIVKTEELLLRTAPKIVVVHGDTNTCLGASIAAVKLQIPIAHVEAGLRSWDRSMPEEINRIIVDKISTHLFAPTEQARKNLLQDGIGSPNIHVCGNTIVDAVAQHVPLIPKSVAHEYQQIGVQRNNYFLVTAHRPSNVDNSADLEKLITLINSLSSKYKKKVIWPVHPRVQASMARLRQTLSPSCKILQPVDYFSMLYLISNAFAVLTDSGGIQEEAYILRKPLLTLRKNTERPETLTANFLVGNDLELASNGIEQFDKGNVSWNDCLGDGNTAKKIAEVLISHI